MPFQKVTINEQDMQSDADRMEFAEWLARYECGLLLNEARRYSELTQDELAKLANVSQAYVSKIESGHGNPPIGRLAALFGAMWFRLRVQCEPLIPQSATATAGIQQAGASGGAGQYQSFVGKSS